MTLAGCCRLFGRGDGCGGSLVQVHPKISCGGTLAARPRIWGLAMSRPDETDPTNPNDLAYYAPRELRERAKSVSLSQEARSEPDGSLTSYRPSSDVRPVYLRPPSAPGAIQQYGVLERDQRRTALFGLAGRLAALAAVVVIVALGFIVMSPALRQSGASSTSSEVITDSIKSEITGSIKTALPQSSEGQNEAKPALAEFQGFLASAPASKPATPERSSHLLEQFLEWRQKANSTEKSQ
jgi:hypothetical protein